MRKSTDINDLLQGDSARLASLRSRSRARSKVLSHVLAALPANLVHTVITAGVEDGRLTLGAANAAWATRLRYASEALRKRVAGTLGEDIRSVRIKVVQPPSA